MSSASFHILFVFVNVSILLLYVTIAVKKLQIHIGVSESCLKEFCLILQCPQMVTAGQLRYGNIKVTHIWWLMLGKDLYFTAGVLACHIR